MEKMREIVRVNIVRLIENSSISQKKIASDVGVSEPTIYRWKSGENAPTLDNIDRLAEVLGVSPLDFFKTEESENNDSLDLIRKILSFDSEGLQALKNQVGAIEKGMEKRKANQSQLKSKNA